MPLIDFSREGIPAGCDRAEFLIVGAGAAGIFMATRLMAAGRRVVLVESGHHHEADDRQALNAIDETAKRQSNSIWNRKRVLGGTTTAWGGQSLPFSPLDFEPRPWVGDVGWPIGYEELEPHYARANAFMGIDPWNYRGDLERKLRLPNPGFDPAKVDFHFSKWAPEPNFFKLKRRLLEQDVTVLYNAQLTRLLWDGPRVRAVELTGFDGRTATLPAGTVLLATGAIEANRILLLAEHDTPGRGGNQSGWLGKAYMDHPTLYVGTVEPTDERRLQRIFSTQWRNRWKYSVRISASETWQREHGMLNTSGGLMFATPEGRTDWFHQLKETVRRPKPAGLAKLWAARGNVAKGLRAFLGDRFVYRPGAVSTLGLMSEQEPSPDSYVALSDETDRFGLRKARLHWRISEKTWRAKRAFAHVLKDEIERLGLGRVTLNEPIAGGTRDGESLLNDVNHHMGGTRMSSRPDDGVVDANLRVWGTDNLYVGTASVFPTSSHSNPTLTLLALCSRLVDHVTKPASGGGSV
jgi:choline dehydrogenase-like flavoprotein